MICVVYDQLEKIIISYYYSNRPQLDIKKQHIIISKVNDI